MTTPGGNKEAPKPQEVNDLHRYSDSDASPDAQHHTLGRGATQAAKGNHVHDGVSGEKDGFYDTVKEEGTALTPRAAINFKDAIEPNAGSVTVSDEAAGNQTTVQFRAHATPDTDAAAASLHHTLGPTSSQAAPGNHGHSEFALSGHNHAGEHSHVTAWNAVGATGQPAFQTTWNNYSVALGELNFQNVMFKVQQGFLYLKGLAESGNAPGGTIFTLPVGFRPIKDSILIAKSSQNTADIRILSNGNVNAQGPVNNNWYSLDGIVIPID